MICTFFSDLFSFFARASDPNSSPILGSNVSPTDNALLAAGGYCVAITQSARPCVLSGFPCGSVVQGLACSQIGADLRLFLWIYIAIKPIRWL